MPLDRLYARSPPMVQSAMATAYGVRERRLRYAGEFRRYASELKAAEWSADELAARQAQRLRAMVRFAADHVPYYQQLFARLGVGWQDIGAVADLAVLPLLDKETVRADPPAFTPSGHDERLIPSTTGGTTGTPLRYMVTPRAMQFNYATYETRFRNWAGVRFGERMATVNGRIIVPAEQTSPPFWRRNLAFNQLYLSAYHLADQNLGAYIDRLRRFSPAVVVGYVSAVHLLARGLISTGRVGEVRPRAVLVSSETLFPEVRADIETAFCCPVFDGYSLGELTAFISQCPEGSMHVSPEYGALEYVNDGQGGSEIVASGLFNRGTVLLRYRTGDLATPVEGRCACGRQLPLSSPIAGRVDDVIVTAEGVRVGPATLSLAFQSCAELREAQMVQAEAGAVNVLLVVTPEFGEKDQAHLDRELRARLGPGTRLQYERVDSIGRTVRGKRPLIVSSAMTG